MSIQFKSKQGGMSFLGLLFVGGLLAVTGVIGAQIVPTAIEYQAMHKAAISGLGGMEASITASARPP